MTVSVIVPNYNHAKYLRQRIDSVLNQTFKDYELIILDDCSQDDSREIIEEYKKDHPEITTVFNATNSGSPCSQWNLGVSMAKGEFLWIAESDDFSEPDFLEKMVNILRNDTAAGLVFCDSRILNEEKGVMYPASERPAVKNKTSHGYLLGENNKISIWSFIVNPISNVNSILFRKSSYFDAGGADVSMKFCSDWLLYLRIFLNSGIRYVPEIMSVYRLHESSRFHLYYRNNEFLFEKFKVYSFLIKHAKKPIAVFLKVLSSMVKDIMIRLIYLFRIDSFLVPELPRLPKQIKLVDSL